MNKGHLSLALKKLSDHSSVLFGLKVKSGSGYNETVLVDEQLSSIEKPKDNSDYFTFSGTAIINLETLRNVKGESSFFKTVADYKNKPIAMLKDDQVEYWDFGTLKRYQDSMFKITEMINEGSETPFIDFLVINKSIKKELVSNNNYNSKTGKFIIDLAGTNVITGERVIALNKCGNNIVGSDVITFNDIIQNI